MQILRIRLSDDEIKDILDNANKRSVSEIADWIGCTVQTVRNQMRKHGIKPKNIIKYNEGDTFAIQSMIRAGYTYQQIADELGRDKKSVYARICYLRYAKGVTVGQARRSKCGSKRILRDCQAAENSVQGFCRDTLA